MTTEGKKIVRRSDEEVAKDLACRAERAKLRVLCKQAAPLVNALQVIGEGLDALPSDSSMQAPLETAAKTLMGALEMQFPAVKAMLDEERGA